jgi:hypothetical protein
VSVNGETYFRFQFKGSRCRVKNKNVKGQAISKGHQGNYIQTNSKKYVRIEGRKGKEKASMGHRRQLPSVILDPACGPLNFGSLQKYRVQMNFTVTKDSKTHSAIPLHPLKA